MKTMVEIAGIGRLGLPLALSRMAVGRTVVHAYMVISRSRGGTVERMDDSKRDDLFLSR